MTKEEKDLLLKELCARLPYEVKGRVYAETTNGEYDINGDMIFFDSPFDVTLDGINTSTEEIHVVAIGNEDTVNFIEDQQIDGKPYTIDEFKPYLRPMSSMTEEEHGQYMQFIEWSYNDYDGTTTTCIIKDRVHEYLDFIYSHNLDDNNLIEKGLALEEPEKGESEEGSEIPVPKTVDEAVSTLGKILSDEDREYLLENGAISMHDSLGRCIRNEWGLWTGSELKDELMKKGFNHPDDMSNYIIEEFIKYWNGKKEENK